MMPNAIMSRIESVDRVMDEFKKYAENRIESEIEMGNILEDLAIMRGTRNDLVSAIEALSTAMSSLESCGFSQEWLECINIDGSFSECVNIDALTLIGSDDKKYEACCEGILSSIWEFLKTIWKWICDVAKKIYDFLKRFFACVSNDFDEEQKIRNLLATAITKGKIHPGNLKDILNDINSIDGGKFYDMMQLTERIGVDIACGAWMTEYSVEASKPSIAEANRLLSNADNLSMEQSGTRAIELGNKVANFIGCKSADALVDDARTGNRKNYIVARFEDTVRGNTRKQPIRPFPVPSNSGLSFRAGGAKDVTEIMKRNKMELINDNTGCRLELFGFDESIKKVDYTEVLPTVDKLVMYIDSLSSAHKELTPTIKLLIKNGQLLEVDITSIKRMIPIFEGICSVYTGCSDTRCSEAWKNIVVIVRSVSIQLSEAFNIATKLYSDMGTCHNTWKKFCRVIEKYTK